MFFHKSPYPVWHFLVGQLFNDINSSFLEEKQKKRIFVKKQENISIYNFFDRW